MNRFINESHSIPVICDFEKNSDIIYLGIVFLTGSCDENVSNNGITHFIEHMVFRGNENYTAKDISYKVESLGGYINAYTTKEYTFFYIKLIKDKFNELCDILFEVCFRPKFTENDFRKEKDIILTEIASIKDNPQEYLGELAENDLFFESGYGLPIAGSVKSLGQIDINLLCQHFNNNFLKSGYFGVISGNFTEKDVEYFSSKFDKVDIRLEVADKKYIQLLDKVYDIDYEQTYISYFLNLDSVYSEDRYGYYLISYMLGETMSSRLFQRLREDLGLCYNISSDVILYKIGGYLSVDCEVENRNFEKFDGHLFCELENIYKKGFNMLELDAAKNQLLLSIRSGFENVSNRFEINVKQFLTEGKLIEQAYIEEKILQYDLQYLNSLYRKIYDFGVSKCRTL